MNLINEIVSSATAMLSAYCTELGRDDIFSDDFSDLIPYTSIEVAMSIHQSFQDKLRALRNDGISTRYDILLRYLDVSPVATVAFCLAVTLAVRPQLAKTFQSLSGLSYVTLDLGLDIASLFYDLPEYSYQTMQHDYNALMLVLTPSIQHTAIAINPLTADARLVAYLGDSDEMDVALDGFSTLYFPTPISETVFANVELLQPLKHAIEAHTMSLPVITQLIGQKGSGKRFLFKQVFNQLELPMLFVNCKILLTLPAEKMFIVIAKLKREQCFYEAGICFYNLSVDGSKNRNSDTLATFEHTFLNPFLKLPYNICIGCDETVDLISHCKTHIQSLKLPASSSTKRIAYWNGFTKLYRLDGIDCTYIGALYKMNVAEIKKAVLRLCHSFNNGIDITDKVIAQTCEEALPPPSHGNIKRMNINYTFDDLKLPNEQSQTIKNICAQVIHRHKVYKEWDMDSKFAYGKSVSVLFVGPPGTGKTMAAHVMANELNLPIYKIDLSQVVDKYIGETEKRLEEIFSTAEKSNVILFFDEADSIFGKRSEVNDAKDKYANTEVSYILQRIEQYDGIIILATNYKNNIDEAFMRRIRYLVDFQLPNEALRKELWKSSFSDKVPLDAIDFNYLAYRFEFAGGSIKNIVLNATFLAADSQTPVTMQHILESIRNENLKMGKHMLSQDFAEYGYLFT